MKQNLALKGKIYGTFGSQIRFAFKVGVDPAIVSKAIHGYRVPDEDTKKLWAKTLRCCVKDIFPSPDRERRQDA